jgi:hypothetical protein
MKTKQARSRTPPPLTLTSPRNNDIASRSRRLSASLACLLLVSIVLPPCQAPEADDPPTCDLTEAHKYSIANLANYVPDECSLVLAPSSLTHEQAGWGVFTLKQRPRGALLGSGDLVIQMPDLINPHLDGIHLLLREYMWDSHETGGFYEGTKVSSIIPGLGMLANGLSQSANILPFVPRVDEGGLTRVSSPGAGAITHYHNYTFWTSQQVDAGDELFVNYGDGWFQERQGKGLVLKQEGKPRRNLEYLREEGRCLDNIVPGQSSIPDAGRGAFARRLLPEGAIVAPVPVLPITKREALDMTRIKVDDTVLRTKHDQPHQPLTQC